MNNVNIYRERQGNRNIAKMWKIVIMSELYHNHIVIIIIKIQDKNHKNFNRKPKKAKFNRIGNLVVIKKNPIWGRHETTTKVPWSLPYKCNPGWEGGT